MGPKSSRTKPQRPLAKPHGVSFHNIEDEWFSENEDDLLDIWHMIQDSIKTRGIVMLDKCKFNHFCEFVLSTTTTHRDRCIS